MSDIYRQLAAHQQSEQWAFQEVTRELHHWCGKFESEFKLEIPACSIAIADISHWRLGQYRAGHNAMGLRGEITFARSHILANLAPDRWYEVLGTLLHELLHGWQEYHGRPGKRNYHNKEFRRRAADLGLMVDQRGGTQYESDSPFTDLLARHGVVVPNLAPVEVKLAPHRSTEKLRLWMCGCPVRVRVGVSSFEARCLRCNQLFELQPPTRTARQ